MKLKQYTKLTNNGVLRTPTYKEVPDENVTKKHGDRAINIQSLMATADDISIDANEESMDRFDRVISLGLAEYILSLDPDNTQWDDITFPWIDANNIVQNISLRQAIALQRDGLTKLSGIFIA